MKKILVRILLIALLPLVLLVDVPSPKTDENNTPSPEPTIAKKIISTYPGAIIEYGMYEQDNDTGNGTEPIEWVVLAKEGSSALIA